MPIGLVFTGEQLRAARALARIEQAELARMAGVSLETVKRLERVRGRVDANVRTLTSITEALGGIGVTMELDHTGSMTVRRKPLAATISAPEAARAPGEKLVHRLIYYSAATEKEAPQRRLDRIVGVGAPRNAALDVTSMLIECSGRYLQVLEGETGAVLEVFGSITSDRRHRDLVIMQNRGDCIRQFAGLPLYGAAVQPENPVFAGEPAMGAAFRPERLSPVSAMGLLGVAREPALAADGAHART